MSQLELVVTGGLAKMQLPDQTLIGMQIDSGSDHSSLMNYRRVNVPDVAVFSVVQPSESVARVASLGVRPIFLRLPLRHQRICWVNSGKQIRFFGLTSYAVENEYGEEVLVSDVVRESMFLSIDFCRVFNESNLIFGEFFAKDLVWKVVITGYTYLLQDLSGKYIARYEFHDTRNDNYFNFVKNKHPDATSIETIINLTVYVLTPQHFEVKTKNFYDEALFRTIEVWGDKISKDTVKKLCAATGRKTQSVSSVLGNGVKDGWAFKELGEWTFDIPLMLNKKRLKPLTESAKTAIKRRAYERKSK